MNITKMILAVTTLLSVSAQAESWRKIVSCEGAAVIVDVDQDQRTNLQIVFRGESMLVKMRDAGLISPKFGDTESVLRGVHFAGFKQVTDTETQPEWAGGVFNPSDLRKIYIQNGEVTAIEVENRGSTVSVKKYHVNQGTRCPDWNDLECRGGVYHKTYVYLGEVALTGCQTH